MRQTKVLRLPLAALRSVLESNERDAASGGRGISSFPSTRPAMDFRELLLQSPFEHREIISMSTIQEPLPKKRIVYPESDGKPIAENTLQFQWIVTIEGGLDSLYRNDPNVFVAGDLLWYPVEGDNKTRMAPDALVAFGRPKGRRGSYRTWDEGGIVPQVVFEVLSPGNRPGAMAKKFLFYQKYGVEEYYIYNPDNPHLEAYIRKGDVLEKIDETDGMTSPRAGIRFDMSGEELIIYRPDGKRFLTFLELAAESDEYVKRVEEMERRSEEDKLARQQAQQRADKEKQRADQEKQIANQEKQRADQEKQRADRLAMKLRELGHDPDLDD
jgi:Uma2 family endonuclease